MDFEAVMRSGVLQVKDLGFVVPFLVARLPEEGWGDKVH